MDIQSLRSHPREEVVDGRLIAGHAGESVADTAVAVAVAVAAGNAAVAETLLVDDAELAAGAVAGVAVGMKPTSFAGRN